MTRSTIQPDAIKLWQLKQTDSGYLADISASWDAEQVTVEDDMGDRTEWQYESIRFCVPYDGDPNQVSGWLDAQETRLLITAKLMKGSTLSTDEQAVYIDYETGANISTASHPLSPIDEQIGILREQLVQIINSLGLDPTDGFASLNATALAEIAKGQAAKEAISDA